MKSELKRKLIAGVWTVLVILGAFLFVHCNTKSVRDDQRYKIEECLSNTADPKWCYEKFGLPPSP